MSFAKIALTAFCGGFLSIVGLLMYVSRLDLPGLGFNIQHKAKYTEVSIDFEAMYPGKCVIKSFEKLRRSSIVYSWPNASSRCYRDKNDTFVRNIGVNDSSDQFDEIVRHSIRSLSESMPWFLGRIYIVTPFHLPRWLNTRHPRIQLINQDDLLQGMHSAVVEQYLHRIPGLSEFYIHMNGDFLFLNATDPHDLFTCNGGIRPLAITANLLPYKHYKTQLGFLSKSTIRTQMEVGKQWGRTRKVYVLKNAPRMYSRRAMYRVNDIFGDFLRQQSRKGDDLVLPLLHHYYMLHQGNQELEIDFTLLTLEEWMNYKVLYPSASHQIGDLGSSGVRHTFLALNDNSDRNATIKLLSTLYPHATQMERPDEAARNQTSINPTDCNVIHQFLVTQSKKTGTFVEHKDLQETMLSFFQTSRRALTTSIGLLILYIFFLIFLQLSAATVKQPRLRA